MSFLSNLSIRYADAYVNKYTLLIVTGVNAQGLNNKVSTAQSDMIKMICKHPLKLTFLSKRDT